MRKLFLIITFLVLFFPNKNAVAEQTRVALLLSPTGPFAVLSKTISGQVEEVKQQTSGTLEITTYDSQAHDISGVMKDVYLTIDRKNQIIIAYVYPYMTTNYVGLLDFFKKFQNKIFIIPFWGATLDTAYKQVNPQNTFILPEPIGSMLLYINKSVGKFGYDVNRLKTSLTERQQKVQTTYFKWGKAISDSVETGIAEWEKKTGAKVSKEASAFLKDSYASDTIEYMKLLPSAKKNVDWAKKNALKEIPDMLDGYYAKTNKKVVELTPLKVSGINGCESLPCKEYCCPKYIEWNHECLQKIDCSNW